MPLKANRRALSAADSAWLRVDRENNHMIITAILILGARVPFSKVQARLAERLQGYPRLQKRVVFPRVRLGVPYWEDDPLFDIDRQTRTVKILEPAGQPALEAYVSEQMQHTLDASRPLWRIDYVENYLNHASKSEAAALVVRVHHCVADGIALLRILLSLSDEPPEITFPTAAAEWARSDPRKRGIATIARWASVARRSASHFAGFLTSPRDPHSRFRTRLGLDKRAVWSKSIPLEDIKAIGRALGGTVNEVLLCAAAGALGRVLANDLEFHPQLVLRGVIPVNLRADEALAELGNRFGLVFMPMPIGMTDARARLTRVRESMSTIKNSPEALAWFAILRTLGRVPSFIEALGVELFSRKASLVITSLAGPQQELHFCGAGIDDIMFWVPSAGNVGLGMSMLAYNGRVRLGVATDAGQVSHPHEIVHAFEEEISNMLRLTR